MSGTLGELLAAGWLALPRRFFFVGAGESGVWDLDPACPGDLKSPVMSKSNTSVVAVSSYYF